jgi:Na+/H+ antiporter NhaA
LVVIAWVAVRGSGLHPTLVGVAVGLLTPATRGPAEGMAERLERRVQPLANYLVLPLFALSAAGIRLDATRLRAALHDRVAVGIALALVVGKTVGVLAGSRLAVANGAARLPDGISWRQLTGGAAVAGVGFTVALFVTRLAFGPGAQAERATIGVLAGSALSAAVGLLVLRGAGRSAQPPSAAPAVPPTTTNPDERP